MLDLFWSFNNLTMKIRRKDVIWKKKFITKKVKTITTGPTFVYCLQQMCSSIKTATWAHSDNQMNTEQLSFQEQVSLGCPSLTPAQHLESRTWDAGWQTQHLTFQSVASMLFETDATDLVFCFGCRSPHTNDKKADRVTSTGHLTSSLRMKYSVGPQWGISRLLYRVSSWR